MLKFLFRSAASHLHARLLRATVPCLCAGLLGFPAAQAAETQAAVEPVPPALASPFDRYQAWRDEPLRDWREANDRVGEIGGWRTYLRESQADGEQGEQGDHDHHGHH
jgi:hypothetical protein